MILGEYQKKQGKNCGKEELLKWQVFHFQKYSQTAKETICSVRCSSITLEREVKVFTSLSMLLFTFANYFSQWEIPSDKFRHCSNRSFIETLNFFLVYLKVVSSKTVHFRKWSAHMNIGILLSKVPCVVFSW